MYISNNVFSTFTRYIDLSDIEFFHAAVKNAKNLYEQTGDLDDASIDKIKKQLTPVLYASTVTKQTNDDLFMSRKEMNERARRRFLIIDADFDQGEEEESEKLYNNCIEFGKKYKTPVLIYPTISYPEKPRFRAVFFVKRLLSYSSYYQAINWLYNELESKVLDAGDVWITSNTNMPIFSNESQLDYIYDTTQDESLEPLENNYWKFYAKPSRAVVVSNEKTENDEILFTDVQLDAVIKLLVSNKTISEYDDFWKFAHSVARAEFYKQITIEQAKHLIESIAETSDDETEVLKWKMDNKKRYSTEKSRVFQSKEILNKSKPLLAYSEFRMIITGNEGKK